MPKERKADYFQTIAETIHRVTALPVSIWAPDKEENALRKIASVGLPSSYVQKTILDLNKPSATTDAYKKNKPIVVEKILHRLFLG